MRDRVYVEGPTQVCRDAGLKVNMKVGYGMRRLLIAGCRIKLVWQEWDLLMLTDRIPNSCKIDSSMYMSHIPDCGNNSGGMWDFKHLC